MTELSRAARDLIDKARPAELADAAAKQRVHAALAVHLALPPVPPPLPAAAVAGSVAAGGTATKLLLICSLTAAGVIGTAAVVKHRHASQHAPAPQRTARVPPPSSPTDPRPGAAIPQARSVQPRPGPSPSRLALAPEAAASAAAAPARPLPEAKRVPAPQRPARAAASGRPEPVEQELPPAPTVVPPTVAPVAWAVDPEARSVSRVPAPLLPSARPALPSSGGEVAPAAPRVTTRQEQTGCSSRGELAFLASAQEALRDGQGERALALLDQHQALCPAATFWEERSAARILALCLLHRERQARSEATLLATRAPRSPQLARLRTSCAAAVIPSPAAAGGR